MKPYVPGPVGALVLAALAKADDGLTAAALTGAIGRPPEQRTSVDQAIRSLSGHGYVRVLRYLRRTGNPSAVWGITTAGQAASGQAGTAGSGT
jgi:hypothetical protein